MLDDLKYIFKYREKAVDRLMLYVSAACAMFVLFHLGYNTDRAAAQQFTETTRWLFYGLMLFSAVRTLLAISAAGRVLVTNDGGLILMFYFLVVAAGRLSDGGLVSFLRQEEWLHLGIFAVALTELSKNSLFFDNF